MSSDSDEGTTQKEIVELCDVTDTEVPIAEEDKPYLEQLLANKQQWQPGQQYPCVSCGACCTGADKIPGFALPTKPNGECIHLQGKLCSIYASRPLSCHMDKFDYTKIGLRTRDEWYTVNFSACERLIRIGRIPK